MSNRPNNANGSSPPQIDAARAFVASCSLKDDGEKIGRKLRLLGLDRKDATELVAAEWVKQFGSTKDSADAAGDFSHGWHGAEEEYEEQRKRAAFEKKFPVMKFKDRATVKREWLAENFVPAKCLTIYSGDGGSGKTQTTLQLAIAKATGGDWFGIPTGTPGRVLYWSCEEPEDDIALRLNALLGSNDVPDNLKIVNMAEADEPMILWNDGERGDGWDFFKSYVDLHDPDLIVIDALRFVYEGDLNDSGKVTKFGTELNRLRRTVVLCSHPSDRGIESGRGTANSTAWRNSARSMLYIREPTKSNKRPHFSVTRVKTNQGKPGNFFELDCDNRGVFTLANDARPAITAAPDKPDARPEFLARLAAINATGDGVTDKLKAKNYAPTVFGRLSDRFTKPDFESAMRALLDDGSVRLLEFRNKKRNAAWRLEVVDFG